MSGLENLLDLSEAINSVPVVESIPLQQFVREHLLPSLNDNSNAESFDLEAKPECLKSAQAFLDRWKLPQVYLDNHAERFKGMGYLPTLILQNPSKQEELPYKKMATKVPTCILLTSMLKLHQLGLGHLPTLNLFPFITEDWLNSLGQDDQQRALQESLDLTVQIFSSYRLETVISCQCLSQRAPKWLEPVVDHPLVKALSSTVHGAIGRTVKRVPFEGRTINVIQGFHPSYILRAPKPEYQNDRHRILSSVLTETYAPCQEWKKQRIANDMTDTTHELQTMASNMIGLISKYHSLEGQLQDLFGTSAIWYSDDEGTTKPPTTNFSIYTWTKAVQLFLSLLPSQPMALELRKYEDPRLTSIFPTKVSITSKTGQHVYDLQKSRRERIYRALDISQRYV